MSDAALGLYVHLPWCVRKCPYCDFNSHARTQAPDENAYVAALIRDLERECAAIEAPRFTSVFFGGGTPSLFASESIAAILDAVRQRDRLVPEAEITLEANPGASDQARFAGYRAAGVNRLSIGVQSLDDAALQRLGRIHDARAARDAVRAARAAGFENLNIDLMYALPDQDAASALADLDRALALDPDHLSYYQLTIEPDTAFAARPPANLPVDDAIAEIEHAATEMLAAAGYARYEVSAWTRPGHQCRHNLTYWRFGDYVGIGAGAHGKLTDPASGQVERHAKQKAPVRYMATAGTAAADAERRFVDADELPFEFMLNALRLDEGFTLERWEARTALPASVLDTRLDAARDRGLIESEGGIWRPTALGRRFLNDLVGSFA